jgi:hypothetical protein
MKKTKKKDEPFYEEVGNKVRKAKLVWAESGRQAEAHIDELRIVVHHHIDYPPELWLLSVHGIDWGHIELKAKTLEEAKKEALERLKTHLERLLEAVERFAP